MAVLIACILDTETIVNIVRDHLCGIKRDFAALAGLCVAAVGVAIVLEELEWYTTLARACGS
jgi:hypothetical protein